jgi:hypothetical protein
MIPLNNLFEPNCLPRWSHCFSKLVRVYQTWTSTGTADTTPPKDAPEHRVYRCIYCGVEREQLA